MTMLKVVVNTLTLNSGVADANNTQWYLGPDEIEGWHGAPVRQSFVDLTAFDGVGVGESQYAARALLLKGMAKCDTENHYWDSIDNLNQLTDLLRTQGLMQVFESHYTKRLNVIRAGPTRLSRAGIFSFFYELPLLAPDPVKYNNTLTSTALSSTTYTNVGTYNTWPTITVVTAGTGALTVQNTSLTGSPTVTFTGLANGDIIDFKNRSVTTSGGSLKGTSITLASTSWWWLKPGANVLVVGGGVSSATLSYRDAWI